jgi:hypothetical protein
VFLTGSGSGAGKSGSGKLRGDSGLADNDANALNYVEYTQPLMHHANYYQAITRLILAVTSITIDQLRSTSILAN